MIERRSNRRARNGRKTPKNVLFVFQNCTFRFADYRISPQKTVNTIKNNFTQGHYILNYACKTTVTTK